MRHVVRYVARDACPACHAGGHDAGPLAAKAYRFGKLEIGLPEGGLHLLRCLDCGVVWKREVPDPRDLGEVFASEAAKVWQTHGYAYPHEVALARRFAPDPAKVDLLDIGAGDGGMLRAWSALPGRRSALDVVRIPACEKSVRGEYVQGFVEGKLDWSGVPYDVVTVYDVVEHLYEPDGALANLAAFTKRGGIAVVETGDAAFPRRIGDWWYANLIEHHVFWTPDALARAAAKHGFEVVHIERGVHKNRRYMSRTRKIALAFAHVAARVPPARRALIAATGRDVALLGSATARDHFTMVLRRA